jgi:flagellar motility protein MotE (MotC chaperone)
VSNADVEKSGYSGFERFLFFLTPIMFTAVLLGVLLLLFNQNWRQHALEIGNKIPLLNAVLPDPSAAGGGTEGIDTDELTVKNAKEKVDELRAQLAEQEAALQKANAESAARQKTIDQLKSQIASLTEQNKEKTISAEQYTERIRSLAEMYGKMTPGKAAPILQNMTVEEAALVLGSMNDSARGRILEKMSPQVAAEVTARLKDAESVSDQQIAALQSRIRELEQQLRSDTSTLDTAQLKQTFTSMDASSAAKLLLQLAASEQSKALRILGSLDDSTRSGVLAAMSKEDSKTTARLVAKLMPANP